MDFYQLPLSPPCRSVVMAAKYLGVELNKKILDYENSEQLKPEYLKLNPQHTVPTLVDDGFSLWESRAILIYLVQKYGKDDTLYPKDPKKQAVVNQRLFFDCSVLYQSFAEHYYPIMLKKLPPNPETYKKLETAMDFLNTFLEGHKYVAGDNLTIADLSILATVSTYDVAKFDIKKYPNVGKWYEHCKKVVPGWTENWEGCLEFEKTFLK